MSSTPFCLGIPVVDHLLPKDGSVILRTANKEEVQLELNKLQKTLTTKDLIKVHPIGYRPDHPVPISKYFIEVSVQLGEAETWHKLPRLFNLWSWVSTGLKKEE